MTDGPKSRMRASKPAVLVASVLAALGVTTGTALSQPTDKAPHEAAGTPTPPVAADPALPAAEPPPAPTPAEFGRTATPPQPAIDWAAMSLDQLRAKANTDDVPAMEELARRLVQGIGVPKDQQAGAGWMLRAAQLGSPQSAFNVGVMYERGFVVERDSTRAVEWYRKAAEAGLAMAKHNLALMLREGKGTARDGKEAIELLRSAARQGMSASMFTLGDIYDRGDVTAKDQALALAWFAITAEFESQTSRDGESQLGKTASQRVQVLKRALLPGELERAQEFGQAEFRQIVAALQPAKPPPPPAGTSTQSSSAASDPGAPGWPRSASDQIRAVQQALLDLRLVRDRPDGTLGPVTRAAIRSFQRGVNLPETGEATRDVYVALQEAIARRNAGSTAKPDGTTGQARPDTPSTADPPGWPKAAVEQVKAVQQALLDLGLLRGRPDGEMGPTTRNAIRSFQRSVNQSETGEPTKEVFAALQEAIARRPPAPPEPPGWPKGTTEQVKAIQQALLDLDLLRDRPDGDIGPATRDAIRAFQRSANLPETGEPTKETYAALREAVARRDASKPTPAADPPGWPAAALDQVKAVQQALLDLGLLRDRPDGDIGPATRDAIRAFQRSVNLRETGEATKDVFAALQEAVARRAMQKPGSGQPTSAAVLDPGKPETARTQPASSDTAWPDTTTEQVSAIQRLLRDLNFTREEPDGVAGPLTNAAIREYQSSVGLPQTGEPSRELFESLREMRKLTGGKAN